MVADNFTFINPVDKAKSSCNTPTDAATQFLQKLAPFILYSVFTSLSASALIQFPRASKDLLMLAPSLNRAPLLDVTIARSEPAKSIRDIFPMVKFACNPAVLSFCRTNTW